MSEPISKGFFVDTYDDILTYPWGELYDDDDEADLLDLEDDCE